ncbi:Uncharacterized protein FWK35_00007377 [Aphis craccivora]|uniref:Uncharacterized protein n=1 Tax=Aphis craccivora TaxID=307492 RepID=A0A6G0ZFB5_APHCR|nr:Uncharacterized protein FWK35_00007377 [Aphis craccivora]
MDYIFIVKFLFEKPYYFAPIVNNEYLNGAVIEIITYNEHKLIIVWGRDSERSDECIDFTMMCVFFFMSVTTFWSMSPVSDRKVNPVWTLGGKSKKFTIVFKSVRKNPKKVTENRNFYARPCYIFTTFFEFLMIKIFTKSVENAKICNISLSIKLFGPFKILENLRVENLIQVYLTIIIKEPKFWCIKAIQSLEIIS